MAFLDGGAWTKRLHPGWAAHAGIVAARLAALGYIGPLDPIAGQVGLPAGLHRHTGAGRADRGPRDCRRRGPHHEHQGLRLLPLQPGARSTPCSRSSMRARPRTRRHRARPRGRARRRGGASSRSPRRRSADPPRSSMRSSACRTRQRSPCCTRAAGTRQFRPDAIASPDAAAFMDRVECYRSERPRGDLPATLARRGRGRTRRRPRAARVRRGREGRPGAPAVPGRARGQVPRTSPTAR